MEKKRLPPDLKKMVRQISGIGREKAPAYRLMAELARDESTLAALARRFPGAGEDSLRQALNRIATLLHHLDEWAAPETRKRKEETDDSPDPEVSSQREESSATTDLDILRKVGKVKVFIDGAASGNPGPAAIGMVFIDLNDGFICEAAKCIGRTTNNVAEYAALIAALETLIAADVREAYFFSDSQLLVSQMKGEWKVKNRGLIPLVSAAQSLRRRLARFDIAYVPRLSNQRADKIAKLALKQARDASVL